MIHPQKGFTLVELVVGLVIVSVLSTVATVKFVDMSNSAKAAACKQTQAQIETAAAIGYARTSISGNPEYPVDIAAMVNAGYLREIPICQSSGTYLYDNVSGKAVCSLASHQR